MADKVVSHVLLEDPALIGATADAIEYFVTNEPDDKERRSVAKNEIESAATSVVEDGDEFEFKYGRIFYNVSAAEGAVDGIGTQPHLTLSVDETYFRTFVDGYEKEDVLAAAEELYDLVGGLYEHLVKHGHVVRYVCGLGPGEVMSARQTGTDFSVENAENGDVGEFFWLQIFPPDLVEQFGRETVLSIPAWQVRELADGAVQFGLGPVPTYDVATFPDRTIVYDQEAIRDHLGM